MKWKFILIVLWVLLSCTCNVNAKETIGDSYDQILNQLQKGNIKGAGHVILEALKNQFTSRVEENKAFIKQILFIGLIAAVFQNFSDAFFQELSSETSFYVTYMMLIACMTNSFLYVSSYVNDTVTTLLDYMKGFFSAYCIAIVSVSGISTSVAMYELYLGVIYIISCAMKIILLPGTKIFFVGMIMNYLSKEDKLTKLCDALEWGIGWALKIGIGIVMGIQLIQSMILPNVDAMKTGIFRKGISMIPGIGQGVNTIGNTLIGSAVIIKNSIGATGIIVMILFLIPPILQILLILLSYYGTSILLQPISDGRVVGVLDGMTRSLKLFLRIIVSISILFVISIAMIAFSTNVNYYAG